MHIPERPALPRLTFKKIAEDLLAIVNLERGIPYTIKRLIRDPGGAMQQYLFEDRQRMVKPFTLLVLLVAVAAYISFRFLPLSKDMFDLIRASPDVAALPEVALRTLESYFQAILQYFNLTYTCIIPFQAGATYLLFRSSKLNYMEHLVINVYIFCVQTLAYILTTPFISTFIGFAILQVVLSYGYFVFALRRIFRESWIETIAKFVAILVILQLAQIVVLLFFFIKVLIWG